MTKDNFRCAIRPMYAYELIEKVDKLPEPKRTQTRKALFEALSK